MEYTTLKMQTQPKRTPGVAIRAIIALFLACGGIALYMTTSQGVQVHIPSPKDTTPPGSLIAEVPLWTPVSIVLPPSGQRFRLMEKRSPNNVLCSSMKMWDPQQAGDDSWWQVIDVDSDGHYFRLQENWSPHNVLCSSMKMWSPEESGDDSWWSIVDYDGNKFFRLEEKKDPNNVLCSSMQMWSHGDAGDDSWWRAVAETPAKIVFTNFKYDLLSVHHSAEQDTIDLHKNLAENQGQTEVIVKPELGFEETETRSWGSDVSESVALGVSVSVEAGIPEEASGQVEVSASTTTSFSASTGGEWSLTTTKSLSVEVSVPPRCYVQMSISYMKYTKDVPYIATKTIYFDAQSPVHVPVSGVFTGVNMGEAYLVVGASHPLQGSSNCSISSTSSTSSTSSASTSTSSSTSSSSTSAGTSSSTSTSISTSSSTSTSSTSTSTITSTITSTSTSTPAAAPATGDQLITL